MAITTSAKKARRASLKKRVFNVRRKKELVGSVKTLSKTLREKGDAVLAKESLSKAYKAIDKAAKRGVIKKNTAARKKSRLARSVAKTATT